MGIRGTAVDDNDQHDPTPWLSRESQLRSRIAELEAGMRRAIHLYETVRPLVMWPMDDEHDEYGAEWAEITLGLVRDALAGKNQ
jgi:hypothetical protein